MADISFHVDREGGAGTNDYVVTGTGASTYDIELIIDNAVGVTQKDVVLALEKFKKAVIKSALFDPLA